MKSQLKKLIPVAIQVIQDVQIANGQGIVPSVYKGYISSFGAGIVQAGLLPAVIFFENAEGDESKEKVCKAIRLMVDRENRATFRPDDYDAYHLSQHILHNNLQYDSRFLKKVTLYAIALKIALRTYKMESNE